MSLFKEFKSFAMRGNVVDMAVGIIIGAGFGKIISSLVSDILMPPIGMLIGGMDFSNLGLTIKEAAGDHAAAGKRTFWPTPPMLLRRSHRASSPANFCIDDTLLWGERQA